MQDRVGQQFGNYRLLRLLGRGGFAEVYLGEHVYMQSKAAVKVLYGPLTTSDAQSFLREARTLASLEHPNIVGIKEFDIKNGIPFLVMHFAPNGTLRQRHPRGQPVPLATIVPYVLQVSSALQYAHNLRIVHRDLKPENMLIDTNDNILLSDFGIAVLSSSTHSYSSKQPAGTYYYMAPEQITGKAVPASDQYALAITVYEWLCGEVPFVGSVAEITAKHLHVPPPPLRDRRIAIEPQVEAVIRHALEKDPQRRFASVQEFALALQSSSKAQQRSNMYQPATSSKDSILLSPSDQTSGFTRNPTQSPTPALPHPTPRITPNVEPSTPGVPSPQHAPTIYPNNAPYAPTQPAPQYPQQRRTGSPCLVTTLISVVLLIAIGIGAVFVVPKILSGFNTATTPTVSGGGPSTGAPANIAVNPQTLKATAGSSTTDCNYWDSFFGSNSGWTCKITLRNNGQNMANWRATGPSEVELQPNSTGFIEAGGSWTLTVHVPLKDCPGSITITITPDGGTPQKVVWNCS